MSLPLVASLGQTQSMANPLSIAPECLHKDTSLCISYSHEAGIGRLTSCGIACELPIFELPSRSFCMLKIYPCLLIDTTRSVRTLLVVPPSSLLVCSTHFSCIKFSVAVHGDPISRRSCLILLKEWGIRVRLNMDYF